MEFIVNEEPSKVEPIKSGGVPVQLLAPGCHFRDIPEYTEGIPIYLYLALGRAHVNSFNCNTNTMALFPIGTIVWPMVVKGVITNLNPYQELK